MITGQTLIKWGFKPGSWFKAAIAEANAFRSRGMDDDSIYQFIESKKPNEIPMRADSLPFADFLKGSDPDNHAKVVEHMNALMKVPTITSGAIMPDACPVGSIMGTIPVGGVVRAKNAIHPDFHSADICCSMTISVFRRDMPVKDVLDTAMATTHFGTGKREQEALPKELTDLLSTFDANPFLKGLEDVATAQYLTQGDGNHFFYVGRIESTGELAIVTHHGSRGLGAQLYKRGMSAAQRHTAAIAPEVPAHNAWLTADTQDGQDYWEALQVIRAWTKLNHEGIHNLMSLRLGNRIVDRFWNEHNFVFQRADGDFYHAKGATPSYGGFSQTLIPLNMAAPILIANPTDNPSALGFAPHGAGRNMSRTAHKKILATEFGSDSRGMSPRDVMTIVERETAGLDVRFFTGRPDLSELPSAYKNAAEIEQQITTHNLAKIEDRVMPLGSIMAGEGIWERKKK